MYGMCCCHIYGYIRMHGFQQRTGQELSSPIVNLNSVLGAPLALVSIWRFSGRPFHRWMRLWWLWHCIARPTHTTRAAAGHAWIHHLSLGWLLAAQSFHATSIIAVCVGRQKASSVFCLVTDLGTAHPAADMRSACSCSDCGTCPPHDGEQ